jgi:hypothetical protein
LNRLQIGTFCRSRRGVAGWHDIFLWGVFGGTSKSAATNRIVCSNVLISMSNIAPCLRLASSTIWTTRFRLDDRAARTVKVLGPQDAGEHVV